MQLLSKHIPALLLQAVQSPLPLQVEHFLLEVLVLVLVLVSEEVSLSLPEFDG